MLIVPMHLLLSAAHLHPRSCTAPRKVSARFRAAATLQLPAPYHLAPHSRLWPSFQEHQDQQVVVRYMQRSMEFCPAV